jgi:RNA polymerase sigma factor (sigma-70 family)
LSTADGTIPPVGYGGFHKGGYTHVITRHEVTAARFASPEPAGEIAHQGSIAADARHTGAPASSFTHHISGVADARANRVGPRLAHVANTLDFSDQLNGVRQLSTQSTDDSTATRSDKSDSSPAELLAGVATGDWAAWREIINRFGPLVLHTAGRTGLSSADAADVAQRTWLLLWKHGHQIRQPEYLGAWLVVAARREAIRLADASRRFVLCADPETEYSGHSQCHAPDVYPVEGVYDGVVEQALAQLPTRYRTLLVLATSDQCLTYAEIAKKMSVPIGSIGPMRMRALEMLENTPEFKTGRFPRPALAKAAS